LSGYPFVGELAGLIKKQKRVQVCHQLLSLNTKIALMPSASFSSGLSHLFVRTAAAGQENKNKQNNSQYYSAKQLATQHENHLAPASAGVNPSPRKRGHKKRNAFHLFFLFEITCACATPVLAFARKHGNAGKELFARTCLHLSLTHAQVRLRQCSRHKTELRPFIDYSSR
jgi:hypothetical protein